MDTNGNPVSLNTLLGKIPGGEITFTQKDPTMSNKRLLPPTFEEVYAQMGMTEKAQITVRSALRRTHARPRESSSAVNRASSSGLARTAHDSSSAMGSR